MSEQTPQFLFEDEVPVSRELQRREFLQLFGGGIVIFISSGPASLAQEPVRTGPGGRGYPTDFNAYLKIGEDGRITCYTGKIEMGQGAITSVPQMIAEELDAPLESVDIVMGDTRLCPWDGATVGSQTTRIFGPVLRAAGAEARSVLLELAAEKFATPKETLQIAGGVIQVRANLQQKVTFAELARGQYIQRHVESKPQLKTPGEFRVMGKSAPRRDAREKVMGKALYAGDIRRPGMLYAKVLRPPAHGARLKSLDVTAAENMAGVRVIQEGELVAVLHELPDVAGAALEKIKADYEIPSSTLDPGNIYAHLEKAAGPGRVVASGGNLEEGERMAPKKIERAFLNAYVAHAPMEPHTALVEIEENKVTVWTSSQAPFRARDEVAQTLAMPAEKVHVISPYVGGGFGGKTRHIQVGQAARLAKLAGKPVQVAWSRADEFFWDTYRPAALVKIKSGLSPAGKIVYWDYEVFWAGERSSQQFYDIPHHRTMVRGDWGGGPPVHPFEVGAWRGPASNTNTFARESQIDILAAAAGIDPVQFRLRNLANPRMARVIQKAADVFDWKPRRGASGRGCGFACADYLGTYVATAAEVEVNRKTGAIQVLRVVCAQDMGPVVNPEGAKVQIEGCVMMGLGYCLTEEIRFRGGEVLDRNFDTYQLPRFSWTPEITTALVESPELPFAGCGEPAITLMGGVMANAVFDATGARMLELPMTPERIKSALEAKKS